MKKADHGLAYVNETFRIIGFAAISSICIILLMAC